MAAQRNGVIPPGNPGKLILHGVKFDCLETGNCYTLTLPLSPPCPNNGRLTEVRSVLPKDVSPNSTGRMIWRCCGQCGAHLRGLVSPPFCLTSLFTSCYPEITTPQESISM